MLLDLSKINSITSFLPHFCPCLARLPLPLGRVAGNRLLAAVPVLGLAHGRAHDYVAQIELASGVRVPKSADDVDYGLPFP